MLFWSYWPVFHIMTVVSRYLTMKFQAHPTIPVASYHDGSLSSSFSSPAPKGHYYSDQHWNCFKGNVGETSERQGGAHMGFPERTDTILNWAEWNWTQMKKLRAIQIKTWSVWSVSFCSLLTCSQSNCHNCWHEVHELVSAHKLCLLRFCVDNFHLTRLRQGLEQSNKKGCCYLFLL